MPAPEDPFTPRNALERALVKATTDPAERGAFLRELLDAPVVVVGSVQAGSADRVPGGAVPAGAMLNLRHATTQDGRQVLPFYSSPEWLSGVLAGPAETLNLRARSLFENTRGATLVLNYGTPWGKEFTPAGVARLLGEGGGGETIVVGVPTPVQLGLPANEPSAYIAAIATIFGRYPTVKAAYLGWINSPDGGTPPHLIIGVEGDGDTREARRDAGAAWDPPEGSGDLVDMMEAVPGADGVAGWLVREGRRFYSR